MKKLFIPLFTFIMFFAFSNSVFAYDFSNWEGASSTKFAMKDSSNRWHTTVGYTPDIWQYQPTFDGSPFATLNHISAEFKVPTKTLKKGTATFQVAFGYHRLNDDRPSKYCEWFKGFGNYSLEYSTNNAGTWTNFSVNTFDCFNNDGFVILSYSVNVPNEINITNLSFGIFGNNSDNIASTVYTAYNVVSSEDPSGTIINQNNTIINQNEQTNQELEDINSNLTDETPPNTDGLNGAAGWLPAGPVDSLINLPLSFFNSISRDLGSSCKPVSLPLPYVNKNLTLPCMSTFYEGIKINSFMDWVGLIASGFILFSYLLKLYKWVDDTLTFRENNHLDNWGGV